MYVVIFGVISLVFDDKIEFKNFFRIILLDSMIVKVMV